MTGANRGREPAPKPDRFLWMVFTGLLALSIVSALLLAARSSTPSYIQSVLDIFLQAGFGALLCAVAFRVLVIFPYRLPDLIAIVSVLGTAMKVVLDAMQSLIVVAELDPTRRLGIGAAIQVCLITASILLGGAAVGLRNCAILKLERAFLRILTVVSGMLFLPAIAGIVTFPTLMLRDVIQADGNYENTNLYTILFAVSALATGVNVYGFIRALALRAEIQPRENHWQDSPPPR